MRRVGGGGRLVLGWGISMKGRGEDGKKEGKERKGKEILTAFDRRKISITDGAAGIFENLEIETRGFFAGEFVLAIVTTGQFACAQFLFVLE